MKKIYSASMRWFSKLQNKLGLKKPERVSENFCIVPWTHTFISPQSERRLCCASREKNDFVKQYLDQPGQAGTQYQPKTLEAHWNGEFLKSVRKKMLAGEKVSECEVCNDKVLNLSPYRDWFNKSLFPHLKQKAIDSTDKHGVTTMKPISFDYRIHNTCNFKCRMCGEQLSSAWEQEKRHYKEWHPKHDPWMVPEVKIKIDEFQKTVVENELIAAIEEKRIEEIYWVGGEPLVWDLHWTQMQRMIELGHSEKVFCRYNTNLSRIEHKGVHLFKDLLPHFKGYLICASIDGTGPIGEWIRTGLKWEQFLNNFKEAQKGPLGKKGIALDVTLTLPGLFSLKEMFDTALELDSYVITKLIFAFDPEIVLSPLALPRPILNNFIDELIEYVEPRVTDNTRSILDTLYDLKNRPTFAEQFPNSYREGFKKGKQRQESLGQRRGDGENGKISLESVYKQNQAVYDWWQDQEL